MAKGPRLQGLIGSTGCRLERKEGSREEEEGERGGKGRVTAGSKRQINGRRGGRGIEEGTGRRDQAEAARSAEQAGAGAEDRDRK